MLLFYFVFAKCSARTPPTNPKVCLRACTMLSTVFLFLMCNYKNYIAATKASASYLRVHYKHCREIAHAIKGMKLARAQVYLKNVLAYKEGIPYTKYTGGIGRHAQAKCHHATGDKISWPQKATKSFLDLLRNMESNAEVKGLDASKIVITHANCNQAPKMRRRTYRAHGRINGKQLY